MTSFPLMVDFLPLHTDTYSGRHPSLPAGLRVSVFLFEYLTRPCVPNDLRGRWPKRRLLALHELRKMVLL